MFRRLERLTPLWIPYWVELGTHSARVALQGQTLILPVQGTHWIKRNAPPHRHLVEHGMRTALRHVVCKQELRHWVVFGNSSKVHVC